MKELKNLIVMILILAILGVGATRVTIVRPDNVEEPIVEVPKEEPEEEEPEEEPEEPEDEPDEVVVVKELTGTMTAVSDKTEITVTITVLDELVIEDEIVKVVVRLGNSTIKEVDYLKGVTEYNFTGLSEGTEYTILINSPNATLENKIEDVKIFTQSTIPTARGTIETVSKTDTSIEVKLDLGITIAMQNGFNLIITGIDDPTDSSVLPYHALANSYRFDNLTPEEEYEISLTVPTEYVNEVVSIRESTTRTKLDITGFMSGAVTPNAPTSIDVDVSNIDFSGVMEQKVYIVVNDFEGMAEIGRVQIDLSNTDSYTIPGLGQNTLCVVSIQVDDDTFLENKVSSFQIRTDIIILP